MGISNPDNAEFRMPFFSLIWKRFLTFRMNAELRINALVNIEIPHSLKYWKQIFFCCMRNSAGQMWKSIPILRIDMELHIELPFDAKYWRKFSASNGIPQSRYGKAFQYSVSTWNSALKLCLMRGIGTNFPLHAEFRCMGIFTELFWNRNRFLRI